MHTVDAAIEREGAFWSHRCEITGESSGTGATGRRADPFDILQTHPPEETEARIDKFRIDEFCDVEHFRDE